MMNWGMEKIAGYIMFCAGLILILFAVSSIYLVFTNVSKAPQIFHLNSVNFAVTPAGSNAPANISIFLDKEIINIINMALYYVFMLFMLSAGAKISSLGLQLLVGKSNKEKEKKE